MRRLVRKVWILALLGVMTTVMVAWGAMLVQTIFFFPPTDWPVIFRMTTSDDRVWLANHVPDDFRDVHAADEWLQDRRWGVTTESPETLQESLADDALDAKGFRKILRTWENVSRIRAGWPWPALECSVVMRGDPGPANNYTTSGCWIWRRRNAGTDIMLPWQPTSLLPSPTVTGGVVSNWWNSTPRGSLSDRWRRFTFAIGQGFPGPGTDSFLADMPALGFIADVAFYALLFAIVPWTWSGPRRIRAWRRRRRGLCVACGFDLRGGDSNVCPECGAR